MEREEGRTGVVGGDDNANTSFNQSVYSPSVLRLWRPAAQRNMRNQWSKILANRQKWSAASSQGRTHASSLVNSHLSESYLPKMDLGVLQDMNQICEKASRKLSQRKKHQWCQLLKSYQELVDSVIHMVDACRSLRCFLQGSASNQIMHFCNQQGQTGDTGDGEGVKVFTFLTVACFENLAKEIVEMYISELFVKRLLMVELYLVLHDNDAHPKDDALKLSDEIYPGEYNDLSRIHTSLSEDSIEVLPKLDGLKPERFHDQSAKELLTVYLTAWISEVNITDRIDEILSSVEEEMKIKLT